MTINKNQIIEDGYNTSYIITFIISLFCTTSSFDYLLNIIPINHKFVYIQEYIKCYILDNFRTGYSVNMEYLNELRNYINLSGWSKTTNDFLELRNIHDFYIYFISNILDNQIIFIKTNIKNKVSSIKKYIINLEIEDTNEVVNLSDVFQSWIKKNIILDNNKYTLEILPKLLPFYLSKKSKNIKVNIMHKIKLFYNTDKLQNNIKWSIYSLICQNEYGYYSIIQFNDEWIKISDKQIPSIINIDMYNKEDITCISKDVVIVFYKLE